MSDIIDYELDDVIAADTPQRLKALGAPVRLLILDLVLERAMTVTELAERVGKAKGTVAHHVDVLVDAGLLRVVRRRKVRAIEERSYGRTARTIAYPESTGGGGLPFFDEAIAECDVERMRDEETPSGFTLRHARIPAETAAAFLARLDELALEFSASPRDGDQEYALLIGLFPTNRRVSPRSGARQPS
jgi:DNA-binding transcriptional ArsR family regulator